MVMSEKNDDEKSVTYTALSAIEFVRKTTVSLSLSLSLSYPSELLPHITGDER